MASSNYTNRDFNQDGRSLNFNPKSPNDILIYTNKTDVHIKDEEEIVSTIKTGELSYKGTQIIVEDKIIDDRYHIFYMASWFDCNTKNSYSYCGLACYGYKREEWIGINDDATNEFKIFLDRFRRKEHFNEIYKINSI